MIAAHAPPPGLQFLNVLSLHNVSVLDENASKAEKLRQGMLQNLTMARDRVQDLCK